MMPSRFEGWGIVAVEAAACGKPVVGSDIPGLRDAVQDNATGLLSPPENIELLTDNAIRLLSDPDLRLQMSRNSLKWAAEFRWEAITEKRKKIYKTIIENHLKKTS